MAPGGINHPIRAVRQGGPENKNREDSRNGIPSVPGSRNAFGGSVRETDDRSGDFLLGEAEGSGTVHGVWGGDGSWVSGSPSVDASWEGSGWDMALGNHGPQRGETYLQDFLTDLRGTTELTRRGVSRTGGEEDGNVDPFLPPACPGYRHRFGGRKPTPPTVPPMQHAGDLTYTE